jgi:6-pyruvoyltetrahydropterin/6-carboxytetrahydropterin synthase
MIIDFSDLKRIVKDEIVDKLDHSMSVYEKAPQKQLQKLGEMFERHFIFNFQPTCENLVLWIVEKIKPKLPEGIVLKKVVLYETTTSNAEWNDDDNQ